jgi:hypothetical protein
MSHVLALDPAGIVFRESCWTFLVSTKIIKEIEEFLPDISFSCTIYKGKVLFCSF